MWNCPVCNREKDTMLCSNCGFDESEDYRNYRSLTLLSESSRKILKMERSENSNILMAGSRTAYIFGRKMRRKQIKTIHFQNHKNNVGTDAWDASEKQDGSVLAWTEESGEEMLDLYIAADGKIKANKDCSDMFYEYINLEEIFGLELLQTDQAETMGRMFYRCKNLSRLDVSGFDTSKVTNMQYMFYGCKNLESLDVKGFDTSKVTNMQYMFYECKKLGSLDVKGFDTSKVTNMRRMFTFCENLSGLDVSGFDTGKVTDMEYMFTFCRKLISIDVSHFNTSQATNMKAMFGSCDKLEQLDISNFDTGNVKNMSDSLTKYVGIRRGVDAGVETEEPVGFFRKLWKK